MIAAGFLAAMWAASFLAKRNNIDPDKFVNGSLIAFMTGILGARLYFVALSWDTFSQHPEEILATWLGGLSLHGGIAGGLLGGAIYCRIAKLPFLRCIDVAAAVVPLAQAIGRWGNFFNSEAFGRPVAENFLLRLYIPPESRPLDFQASSYFHPTFLYESVWNLWIFALLYFFLFDKLKAYPGMNFLMYVLLYSIGRLLIEPLRTDSIMLGNLPTPSVVSAVLIVVSSIALVVRYSSIKKRASSENDPKA